MNDCKNVSRNADAALVIGDSALTQPWGTQFKFCFDLGSLWYEMTQLPFVFAVWAVRRSFAQKHSEKVEAIHNLLLASRDQGYRHIEEIISAGRKKLNLRRELIKKYFSLLHCDLDSQKVHAMKIFFDSLLEQEVLNEKASIQFFKP